MIFQTQSQNENLRDCQIKKIESPFTANKSFSPKMIWINNSRIKLRFTGSCLRQEFATFTPNNVANLFILYELDRWSQDLKLNLLEKIVCLES